MKQETELEKIKRIMSAPDRALNHCYFTALEKINAIQNWAQNSGVDFDTELIDRCEDVIVAGRELSERRDRALDNIISGYRINVEKWLV